MEAELGVGMLVVAVGFYILCSQYLLHNPLILHKKKRLGFYSRHISHRGGECASFSHLCLLSSHILKLMNNYIILDTSFMVSSSNWGHLLDWILRVMIT